MIEGFGASTDAGGARFSAVATGALGGGGDIRFADKAALEPFAGGAGDCRFPKSAADNFSFSFSFSVGVGSDDVAQLPASSDLADLDWFLRLVSAAFAFGAMRNHEDG